MISIIKLNRCGNFSYKKNVTFYSKNAPAPKKAAAAAKEEPKKAAPAKKAEPPKPVPAVAEPAKQEKTVKAVTAKPAPKKRGVAAKAAAATAGKVSKKQTLRGKSKKKKIQLHFAIDCTNIAEDSIMDVADFVSIYKTNTILTENLI